MSTEEERLSELVSRFGDAMRAKLWKKQRQGYRGWDDTTDPGLGPLLRARLDEHIARYQSGDAHQLVDIANFCAMLWDLSPEKGG